MVVVRRIIVIVIRVCILVLVIQVVCTVTCGVDGSSGEVMLRNASDVIWMIELGDKLLTLAV